MRLSWKLGSPLPPLPPLLSSSILHDSLQSVNLELNPHDAIAGMVTGGGRKQEDEEGVTKRVGANRLEEARRSEVEEEGSKYLATFSLSLSVSVSLYLSHWVV